MVLTTTEPGQSFEKEAVKLNTKGCIFLILTLHNTSRSATTQRQRTEVTRTKSYLVTAGGRRERLPVHIPFPPGVRRSRGSGESVHGSLCVAHKLTSFILLVSLLRCLTSRPRLATSIHGLEGHNSCVFCVTFHTCITRTKRHGLDLLYR